MVSGPVWPFFILKIFVWQAVHFSANCLCCSWLNVTGPGLSFPAGNEKLGGTLVCAIPGTAENPIATTAATTVTRSPIAILLARRPGRAQPPSSSAVRDELIGAWRRAGSVPLQRLQQHHEVGHLLRLEH